MKFFVHTQKPYPVVMAHDLFDCLGEMVLQLHPRCKVALLCDDDVDAEYGGQVRRSLESESYRPCRIPLPAGEACKTWAVLGEVLETLAEEGFTRGDLLMALGGGTVPPRHGGHLPSHDAACRCRCRHRRKNGGGLACREKPCRCDPAAAGSHF